MVWPNKVVLKRYTKCDVRFKYESYCWKFYNRFTIAKTLLCICFGVSRIIFVFSSNIYDVLMKRCFMFFFNMLFLRFPSQEALYTIYSSILTQHLKNPANKFNNNVIKLVDLIVTLSINFQNKISTIFLPTAIKFHYIFNLRDMSNVFQVKQYLILFYIVNQILNHWINEFKLLLLILYYINNKGILFATGECVTTTSSFIRLWFHETTRIYGDKLIEKKDQDTFSKLIVEQIKKTFSVSILYDFLFMHILYNLSFI